MRLFSVVGAVSLAVLLSAFSWGDRAQEEKKPSSASYDYSSTASAPQVSSKAVAPKSTVDTVRVNSAAPAGTFKSQAESTASSARTYASTKAAEVESRVQETAAEVSKKGKNEKNESKSWEQNYASKPADPMPGAQTAQNTAVAGAPGFPSELITSLAQGDEATRRARIESLKRLSQALAQVRAQQTVTTPVVAETKPAKKR